jgi:precorrin-6A/cobalt-precorrin-6A reductase
MKVLILGGSSEASALARALAGEAAFQPTISLAGRTQRPAPQPVPTRVGGFGGADGLARYLTEQSVDALIDATHPFAAIMSRNAATAARQTGVPLLAILRPSWKAEPGDRWIDVPDIAAAAEALGMPPRRVLLTIGRKDLAAFVAASHHHYVLRSVDAPPAEDLPPQCEVISARGPFALEAEIALLRDRRIDLLVTKNSGAAATAAKLEAARLLTLPVVMIARPPAPDVPAVPAVAEALAWLHAIPRRGE